MGFFNVEVTQMILFPDLSPHLFPVHYISFHCFDDPSVLICESSESNQSACSPDPVSSILCCFCDPLYFLNLTRTNQFIPLHQERETKQSGCQEYPWLLLFE